MVNSILTRDKARAEKKVNQGKLTGFLNAGCFLGGQAEKDIPVYGNSMCRYPEARETVMSFESYTSSFQVP
jgi:hypothetical protein